MENSKKLNGRPKLKSGKRSKKIDARFTEAEYDLVFALEKQLGISRTELVRMRVLNNGSQILLNAKELIREIDHIGAEMGRVGNNINQLAKHANTLKLLGAIPPSVADQFNSLFLEYITVLKEVGVCFRKVIRLAGH